MEEKINFKPKIRIQLLDDESRVLDDRMVDQYTELINGPKKTHDGPLRVDLTLMNQQDIDLFKEYLDKLKGKLPIKEMQTRGRPSTQSLSIESPREDILVNVEKIEDQDEVIKYLRDLGFVFLLTEDFKEYFPEFEFDEKDIGKPNNSGQYLDSLSWMVRCIKRAKDPKSDKYDKMIIFGFSLINGRSKKVVPYLYGERKKPLRIPVKDNTAISFSKVTELTKFPVYMVEAERLKFSTEMRKLMYSDDLKPSKFFMRWYRDVKFSDENQKKINEIVKR